MRALGFAVALAGSALLAGGPRAGETAGGEPRVTAPLLPGVGARDPRHRLNPDALPWRAVGKLQASAAGFRISCTATLVGPSMVATAAHCLLDSHTGRSFAPGSLHFLIGYDGSHYAGHAVGVRIETGSGFDPARPRQTIGSDWALVTLDNRLGSGDRILPILRERPEIGTAVMLGGYQQDHPLVLMADTECRLVGYFADASGRGLARHDCAGTRGVSGAPLLIERAGKWYVAGIDVAAATGAAGGAAVVLGEAVSGY